MLAVIIAVTATAEPLRLEFWLQKNPISLVSPGGNEREPGELSERERLQYEILLDDARWAFSGMIYGFDIRWTPSSRARGVEEELTVTPVALIPKKDSRMNVVSFVEENGFVFIQLEYHPDETQERRIAAWRRGGNPQASGYGAASVFLQDSRRASMEQAIKESIRSWLRAREYNRPREIDGWVAFVSEPETSFLRGEIRAFVTLSMDLKPLRAYRID